MLLVLILYFDGFYLVQFNRHGASAVIHYKKQVIMEQIEIYIILIVFTIILIHVEES